AGLHGIEAGLELPPPLEGNAYESDAARFPSTLREAIAALEAGTMARGAFGDEGVDHYLNYGRTEQRLFDSVVTCWERERLFERGWDADRWGHEVRHAGEVRAVVARGVARGAGPP